MIINKPPMGWNSWNTFGDNINEKVICEMADEIVAKGLKDVGYEYVVIDDCWSLRQRDKNDRIVADPVKFPNGMRAVADYVHSLGLKFGMYSCAGLLTCAGFPGSFEREFTDAETFASFDVDFLKYDYCYFPSDKNPQVYYARMGMALKATGRDILFSACNWGSDDCEKWVRSTGAHMYRSTGDIFERFSSIREIPTSQFDKFRYSAPGCYNDLDMLVCGMDGIGNVSHTGLCGDTEYKTHFAIWCVCGSPLMIGTDLKRIRPEMLELLKNEMLIRIDSDEEARPPIVVDNNKSDGYVLFKHLSDGQAAVGLFNLSDEDCELKLDLTSLGFGSDSKLRLEMTDAFDGSKTDYAGSPMSFSVKAHDCVVFLCDTVLKP